MDFTRKTCLVGDGHSTPTPSVSTYVGVVSRETVRIAFTYGTLNDLEVFAANIQNAYLQALCSQKCYTICGPEFGAKNTGKYAIVKRSIYGTKSAGVDFCNHLCDCMHHLGFESCLANPDLWMCQAIRKGGATYYGYLLLYVDNALAISKYPAEMLRQLRKYFQLKQSSIGPPDTYLGGKVSKVELPNGVQAYQYSSAQYVKHAVKNVETFLHSHNTCLPCKTSTPISVYYWPELDVTPELDAGTAAYFQSLIGILRWDVELKQIDITCEVLMFSSHLTLPREGHLNQVFHAFAYLKYHHNVALVFDPTYPDDDFETDIP
mmetsp:Transcript_1849/g.3780  ORF Transcript_1849/g.3780 Transcript_1849/m.3780 type:complete len:320 (-) Transcript_1849:931-1890(-)